MMKILERFFVKEKPQIDMTGIPKKVADLLLSNKILTDEILQDNGVEKKLELRAMREMNDGTIYIGEFSYENESFCLNWHPEKGWIIPENN